MKKLIPILVAVVIALLLGSPVLAASLGISPTHAEIEVPADGSATANFEVHWFSGELRVSLVDIPLKVEPETIHIEPSSEPVDIELTFYGDESLGSQMYDGYIRFLGMSGGTVAVAVKIKAIVTNLVEGETPVLASPEGSQLPPEESSTPPEQATPTEQAPPPSVEAPATELPILLLAGIASGTAIVITLIVVLARRKRY